MSNNNIRAFAAKCVEVIERDLSGRKGLGNEWEQIDDETRDEIRERWRTIIQRNAFDFDLDTEDA